MRQKETTREAKGRLNGLGIRASVKTEKELNPATLEMEDARTIIHAEISHVKAGCSCERRLYMAYSPDPRCQAKKEETEKKILAAVQDLGISRDEIFVLFE